MLHTITRSRRLCSLRFPIRSVILRQCSYTCRKCSAELQSKWFCPTCEAPQVPSSNYFELMECNQCFDQSDDLSKHFIKFQKQIHPDRFHSYGEDVVRKVEKISAVLNNAYSTLKEPVERSKYLLKLRGVEYGEDIPPPGPEFLMDVMDIREEIEETTDHDRLRELQQTLQEKKGALVGELSSCYKDFPDVDTSVAVDLTSRLIYVDKLLKAIYDRLPSS
uniref:J domain-containing protein n=1 Tax=Vannella robusta TaxID=1487602 RepID=A0A7S4I5J2_9EUKA|mmetsp:Transcript_20849/g.26374  ORF Transcript_20849/g.26374 Transcript_20849/m.26374 type:complete len:220 (+) Transcript_20849:19-678(+)